MVDEVKITLPKEYNMTGDMQTVSLPNQNFIKMTEKPLKVK